MHELHKYNESHACGMIKSENEKSGFPQQKLATSVTELLGHLATN
jgi:hypothetical protein